MVTPYPQAWERNLLSLAYQAPSVPVGSTDRTVGDPALLARAYALCDRITSASSHSFCLATRLLPADKRRAVRALYAFCRTIDDIVDHPGDGSRELVAMWRRYALSPDPPPDNLVAVAWADTRRRYQIPSCYVEQLIQGVTRDWVQTRYRRFEELAAYAYGVASTVGLMSMHIIGCSGVKAIPYAVRLGIALQVTNVLRDVGEDWRAGRLYLPLDELAAYGLAEGDVAAGRVDERWRAFMRFQIERNRRLYAESLPGIACLNSDGRLAVAAAAELYHAILEDIEAHDYDVFNRRAHVSKWGKLSRLPGIMWRSRQG